MSVPRPVIGAVGGFLATIPMTLVMTALYPLLPEDEHYALPPSQITAHVTAEAGAEPSADRDRHRVLTFLSHFGFGSLTGALFAPLATRLPVSLTLSGIAWGGLVWAGSYMGWLPALGVLPNAKDEPRGRNALMIGAHLVWGLCLGLMVQYTSSDRELH